METRTKSNFAIDMTKGNEMWVLIQFAFPLFIGNLVQQLYTMADSVIVGRYINADALGAIGSVGSITFLFFSLCNGLSGGIGVLISQYMGAGEADFVKKIIGNALYITAVIGVLISVIATSVLRVSNSVIKASNNANCAISTIKKTFENRNINES